MLSLAAGHLGRRWAAAGPAAALAATRGFSAAAAAAEPFGEQLLADEQAPPFAWVQHNQRPSKPRKSGLTEIRASYYTVMTPTYLQELLEAVGHAVDGLEFAGGSFSVHSRSLLRQLIDIAHEHGVYVSTGGWIEHVLTQGPEAVQPYLRECKQVGFDYVELSTGFISLPTEDWVGIQFGAGGDSAVAEPAAEGTLDASWAIRRARACLDAGAPIVMVESEGITEDVASRRTDVVLQMVDALGAERLMFEAADPPVFSWYVKTLGASANLFVDHSQVVQLECLRRGIWGTKSTWGRVLTYQPSNALQARHARSSVRPALAASGGGDMAADRQLPDQQPRQDCRSLNSALIALPALRTSAASLAGGGERGRRPVLRGGAMSAQEIHFPTEEEGMEGIKINIKHDLGSGGDPTFSGAFHGAGSGGVEPVSPKSTGLARADSLGLDKAAGVRRGPGTAGAHPAMVSGGGSGVGVGGDESPASSPTASKAGAGSQDAHEGQGVVESAKEAVAGAAQSAKEAVGL